MKMRNCGLDIHTKEFNLHKDNPVIPGDVKRKKVNGKFVKEVFYVIDFADIRDNAYVISSFGRVFSLLRKMELKKMHSYTGYNAIQLQCNDGVSRKFVIPRLVARAFIEKTEDDKEYGRIVVHHKNWKCLDDYYWNLEWRSPLEVYIMAKINGGEFDYDEAIVQAKKLFSKGIPLKQINEVFDGYFSRQKLVSIRDRI